MNHATTSRSENHWTQTQKTQLCDPPRQLHDPLSASVLSLAKWEEECWPDKVWLRFTFHLHSVSFYQTNEWLMSSFVNMNRGLSRTSVSGGLAHVFLLAILQAVTCDCKPIQGSIRVILCVNGDLLSCSVHNLSSHTWQPWLPAFWFREWDLGTCDSREAKGSPLSVHFWFWTWGYIFYIHIPKECRPQELLKHTWGSRPRVFIWPLDCLKKDICDSLRLSHRLPCVGFLIAQQTLGKWRFRRVCSS